MRFINVRQQGVSKKILTMIVYIFLVSSTVVVYWQISDHEFISFDDPTYITDNSYVKAGLNINTIKWAFSIDNVQNTYWHPLTWLSHMLDVELFGLDAGKHHLVNLFFHVLNILLLFFLLNTMTGSLWESALVASFFGLHPVNVDSVAWLAERKNVLSTFFWLLTILTYYYYVKKPNIIRYVTVVLCFVMGLLAKPMLVTLPFVLLLLDYWPLSRISFNKHPNNSNRNNVETAHNREVLTARALQLIREKIPLFVLSLVPIYLANRSLQWAEKINPMPQVPFILRMENAIVSYLTYFTKMIWPRDLTFFYPYPTVISPWKVLLALIVLLAVTTAALRMARRAPYFLVGWLWYVGTLVPVLGLMQGGLWPEIAERWAYIPFIGLFIIIVWGVPDALRNWRFRRVSLASTAGILIMLLMIQTWIQVGYWQNNKALYTHALKINPDNIVALNNLGQYYFRTGDYRRALAYFNNGVRIKPGFVLGLTNMGETFYRLGKKAEAISEFQEVIQIDPMNYNAYFLLANIFYDDKEFSKAKDLLSKALLVNPLLYKAQLRLGNVYLAMGNKREAYAQIREALRINPYYAPAYHDLGNLEDSQGSFTKATEYYMKALQIDDSFVSAHLRLGNVFMKLNKMDDAIMHFKKAVWLQPDNMDAKMFLGNALIRKNDFAGALDTFEAVLRKDPNQFQTQLVVGMLFLKIGKIGNAIEHLNKAKEIDPSSEKVRENLNKAKLILERGDEAIKVAEKDLKIDPKNISLYLKLGDLYAEKGDAKMAQDNYLNALSLETGSPRILTRLAVVNSDNAAYDNAIFYLKKIIEAKPEYADAYYNISCIYAKQKKVDASILWLRKAIKVGFHDWKLIKEDWDLENIRYTQAYKDLIRDIKETHGLLI